MSTFSLAGQVRDGAIPLGFSPRLPWFATAAVLFLALFLGGGTHQGLWSDAIVQLAALALIAVTASALPSYRTSRALLPLAIMAASLFLPLLQTIPLPPSVWTRLPGRQFVIDIYAPTGQSLPWLPVSLDRDATWRSALSLLVPLAIFLATLRIGYRGRRSLSLLVIVVAIVSVVAGLGQLMQGQASSLRFFPVTNAGDSVGFFANRNHYAALLYCAIPLTAAWLIALLSGRLHDRWVGIAACVLTYIALILGLAMARSRAGVFLAIAVAVASFLFAGVDGGRFARRGFIAIGVALLAGTIGAVQYAFFGLLSRMDDSLLADFRFTIANLTAQAAHAFLPFGSGFGTFVNIYARFETPSALLVSYVNHAHDDWLEVWLEGGWIAAAIGAAALAWFLVMTARVWGWRMRNGASIDRNLARAASVAIIALLIHSLVDYPLRTTALMSVAAFCAALMVEPIAVPERDRSIRTSPSDWIRRWLAARGRKQRAQRWKPARAS